MCSHPIPKDLTDIVNNGYDWCSDIQFILESKETHTIFFNRHGENNYNLKCDVSKLHDNSVLPNRQKWLQNPPTVIIKKKKWPDWHPWCNCMENMKPIILVSVPHTCRLFKFRLTLIKSDVFLSTLPVCFMTRTRLSSLEPDRDLKKKPSCPNKERSRCQNGSCLFVARCHLAEKKVAKEKTL